MAPHRLDSARRVLPLVAAAGLLLGCDRQAGAVPQVADRQPPLAPAAALSDSTFGALVARISEPGGFFDTDNLISNERGYLKVLDAIDRMGVRGGGYVGVGPDQNFSYLARIRPAVAFIADIRRDNLLHHLLLKALVERSPTRVEFLSALHGRSPPAEPETWREATVGEVVDHVDGATLDPALAELREDLRAAVRSFGVPLSEDDLGTIERFHQAFIDAGPSLRFTSFGRPPRPHYPTYRQLLLETDLAGRPASYLATAQAYGVVRDLQLGNRIVPVVGDLAGPHALREIGRVLEEMDLEVSALYASNVEFYLWRSRTIEPWLANVASLPAAPNAVVVRSYFPNFGAPHPSAVPGYYATQTLQPLRVLRAGGFRSYWDLVTRDAAPLGGASEGEAGDRTGSQLRFR